MQNYTGGHKRAAGPACKTCRQSEADCAWNNGACCPGCSHWRHLDANGNDRGGKPGRVPTSCEPCRFRRVSCVHRTSPDDVEQRLPTETGQAAIRDMATETAS